MNFYILLKRISPRLKNLSRYLLRTQSAQSSFGADDIYQEMCLHLWQRFKNGVSPEFNDAYIVKSCEFHIRNFLRKKIDKLKPRSLEEPLGETGLLLKDTLISSLSHHNDCFNHILIEEIRKKISNEKEEGVFNLLLKGHTVRDIGKNLGISHVMVVKYKNRIVKRWKNEVLGYQKEKTVTYGN
ncbi:MAG: hypothetical protein ABIC68_07445 [Candidatus Omnitrophota bacterium]